MDRTNGSQKIRLLFFTFLALTLATFVLPGFGEALASRSGLVPSGFFPLIFHEAGSPGTSTSTPTATATRTATPTTTPTMGGKVQIVDFAFQPAEITIHVGESIEWENTGSFDHTATSDTGVWDSGTLAPGEKFSFVFNTPGDYPYHCSFHPEMTGIVHVVPNP